MKVSSHIIKSQVAPIVILILSCIIIVGCTSNKLTRSKAEEIIKQENNYPSKEIRKLDTSRFYSEGRGRGQYGYSEIKQKLEARGLGEIEIIKGEAIEAKLKLSEKGRKYVSNQTKYHREASRGMKAYDYYIAEITISVQSLGEVTGITFLNESETIAQVEYTVITEPTPFKSVVLAARNYLKSTTKHKMRLSLYDDGWRKFSR